MLCSPSFILVTILFWVAVEYNMRILRVPSIFPLPSIPLWNALGWASQSRLEYLVPWCWYSVRFPKRPCCCSSHHWDRWSFPRFSILIRPGLLFFLPEVADVSNYSTVHLQLNKNFRVPRELWVWMEWARSESLPSCECWITRASTIVCLGTHERSKVH